MNAAAVANEAAFVFKNGVKTRIVLAIDSDRLVLALALITETTGLLTRV
jgi:hypothetical protein